MTFRKYAIWLASIEYLVVAICLAFSFVSARFLPIALIIALLYWIIRWIAYGHFSINTPADWTIGLLVLTTMITIWITLVRGVEMYQVYRLLYGIAIYYAIVNWAVSFQRIKWIVVGIVIFGLFLAVFALVGVEWSASKLTFFPSYIYDRFILLVSDSANPNVMAGTLILLLPVVIAHLLFNWTYLGWTLRIVSIVAFLSMTGVLVLTQSRSAWVAFYFSSIGLITLRWKRGWIVILLSLILIVAAFSYFENRLLLGTIISSASIGGIDGRLEAWSRAIFMIQDFPYTGVGMGLYGDVADLMYPFYLHGQGIVTHAHNLLLQVAVDLGLPGLISWLVTFLIVVILSLRIYYYGRRSNHGSGWVVGIGAGLFCSQLALFIHGLTDAVTWGMVRPAPIVWVVWGLVMATWLWLNQDYRNPQLNNT